MALGQFARTSVGFLLLVATGVAEFGFAETAHAQNWDGSGLIRFGAFLQGSFTDFDTTQTPPAAPAFRQTTSPDGLGGGVVAGYDMRFGQIIVGGEIDASWDNAHGRPPGSQVDIYAVNYLATARARLGLMVHPNVLLYGTGGLAMLGAEYKFGGPGTVAATAGVFNQKSANMFGLALGGGIEYDAGWGIMFGEYLYNDYGSWTFGNFNRTAMAVDATGSLARIGIKFTVGHDFEHDTYRRPEPLK